MTDTFDWVGLQAKMLEAAMESLFAGTCTRESMADILQREIKAAFVLRADFDTVENALSQAICNQTARAEAAEARVTVLEEALQWVLDHDPKKPGLRFDSYEALLESLMSRPLQALGAEHEAN